MAIGCRKNTFGKFCLFKKCIIWHSKSLQMLTFFYKDPHFISAYMVIGTCCYFLVETFAFSLFGWHFQLHPNYDLTFCPWSPKHSKHTHFFTWSRHEYDFTVVDDIKQSSIWFTHLIQVSYVYCIRFN